MSIDELLHEQEVVGKAFDDAVQRGLSVDVLDLLMRRLRELSRLIADSAA